VRVCVQGQPSQGWRAAASVEVESHVEAVVAATQQLRAGGDRQTATASRDAALAAIRSIMAALHPEAAAVEAEAEAEGERDGKATTVEGMAEEMLKRFVRTLVTGVVAAKEKQGERSCAVVTKDDVAAALASSPFAGMVRPRASEVRR
jgi:hypothetical protein